MSGVYNRKLFQTPSARDQLRQAGGIMSSSPDLMMSVLSKKQPQKPMAPTGYADGGSVLPTAMMAYNFMSSPEGLLQGAGNPALIAGSTLANLLGRNVRDPSKAISVDITAPAGTVRDPSGPANSSPAEAIAADIVAKAEDLASKVDTTAPEDIGKEIVNTAASKGVESSGDLKFDLASIYERMTGDASGYEKNIDSLNRGIIGAAIGAGTSARATENISNGLLVGMQAAKATEERRAGDEQAINAALFEALLKPKDGSGAESSSYRSPINAYQDAKQYIMDLPEADLPLDPITQQPVDRVTYAADYAYQTVVESYPPEALIGTPFEGRGSRGGTSTAAPSAAPTLEQFIAAARATNPTATDEQLTEYYNKKYGG